MDDRKEQEVSKTAGRAGRLTGPVFTIGHSVRPIDTFLELLARHDIEHLIDVRRHPGSRRYPQFGGEALASALARHGITYSHEEALGGRRVSRKDSRHVGWRNASFRGYADHMDTAEFDEALERVRAIAARQRTVLMCAEALPWRCHRSLIADALVARGTSVLHILDNATRPHELPPFARVTDGLVEYPATPGDAPPPDLFAS